MNNVFYTFGEILWDCLPSGRHAGGAPFNVAAHLAQLGVSAALISAVGADDLGDEILQVAAHKRVDTRFVGRARPGLATGTVIATIDNTGNATYDIVQPVAWDEIMVPPDVPESVERSAAFVFGSLAARSPHNLGQLQALLALPGPLKCFDVNLRSPFVDLNLVVELGKQADVIKLNLEEAILLGSWLRGDEATSGSRADGGDVAAACADLARATGAPRICVTMGAAGAAWWEHGNLVLAPAPPTAVKDTVGAGDAFMACLVVGLTRGGAPQSILGAACRLGAFVASHDGATPLLPAEMKQELVAALGPSA